MSCALNCGYRPASLFNRGIRTTACLRDKTIYRERNRQPPHRL